MTLKHPLTASERETLAACLNARRADSTTGLNACFGRFSYRNLSGGQIEITDTAWVRQNIVEVSVADELPGWPVNSLTGRPQGKLYIHRLARAPLLYAWREIRARGLHTRLRTYDGLWVPRHKLHNLYQPLSVHSWAAAVDFDARWNGYGVTPVIDEEVIRVFESFGWQAGKRWRPADGMHVQLTRALPGVPVMPWQDSALAAPAVTPAPKPAPIVVTAKPAGPPYVAPPKVFLRGIGLGNEEMVGKEARYGGGTVTRLADGRLRLENFTGTVGVYHDHALQLDRLEGNT